jgi:hypothetical protein
MKTKRTPRPYRKAWSNWGEWEIWYWPRSTVDGIPYKVCFKKKPMGRRRTMTDAAKLAGYLIDRQDFPVRIVDLEEL